MSGLFRKALAPSAGGCAVTRAIRNFNMDQQAARYAIKTLMVILSSLFVCLGTTDAEEPPVKVPPHKFSLSVGRVYESKPDHPEWVFIIGGTSVNRGGETVCRSPEALKRLIKGLPRGSTLDWWLTCGGESEALAGQLDDLKKICTDAGIVFTIHTSG